MGYTKNNTNETYAPLPEAMAVNSVGSSWAASAPGLVVAGNPLLKSTRAFSLEEVQVATTNFNTKIGEGGFGPVYFGELPSGGLVAVKVNATTSGQGSKEFATEVSILSRVHHKNLVSLVGYSVEGFQQILMYEFMENGTLREHLYGKGVTKKLGWKSRLDVALNSARGLEYLHNDCYPKVIHRDVKSSNILLNHQLQAKVADFGISKVAADEENTMTRTASSVVVRGTMGYLDPEFFMTNKLTQKSDVYAFGVVLLEIIAGRAPHDASLRNVKEWNLVEFARGVVSNGSIGDLVDKSLRGTYSKEAMRKLAELAVSCVKPLGVDRPAMSQVVREITKAIDLENNTAPLLGDMQKEWAPNQQPDQTCCCPCWKFFCCRCCYSCKCCRCCSCCY